jgi:hypothetical protein
MKQLEDRGSTIVVVCTNTGDKTSFTVDEAVNNNLELDKPLKQITSCSISHEDIRTMLAIMVPNRVNACYKISPTHNASSNKRWRGSVNSNVGVLDSSSWNDDSQRSKTAVDHDSAKVREVGEDGRHDDIEFVV